jgi:hypothetical protein
VVAGEPSDEGETEMTSMTDVVVTNPSEMCELTIDELDQAGGGIIPLVVACVVWACVGYAGVMTFYG